MHFLEIFVHTFVVIYERRWVLVKFLSVPIILNVIADAELWAPDNETLTSIEALIITPYLYTIIAVTTHRIILLGEDSVTITSVFIWKRRELRFFVHILAVAALSFVLLIPSLIPFLGLVVSLVLIGFVVSRLCLVFPGTAIDQPVTFRESWRMTREYRVLMTLVIFAVPLLVALPMGFINLVIDIQWLNNFVSSLATIVEIAALSVTYQFIQQEINFERF